MSCSINQCKRNKVCAWFGELLLEEEWCVLRRVAFGEGLC